MSNFDSISRLAQIWEEPFTTETFTYDAFEAVAIELDVTTEFVWALAALLSDAERQRANRFAFNRDRRRFIVARARLRQLIGARLDQHPGSIGLVCGPHGKPALAAGCADSNLRFNVSHSGNIAVYAFAQRREIGIDVELIRVLHDADEIASRFFSRRENEAYRALNRSDRPLGFFNCWTRKEAFVKALGEGLYHPLDRFDVSLAPGEPVRILSIDSSPPKARGWQLESFCPAPGYVAAVATENTRPSVDRGRRLLTGSLENVP